VVKPSAYTSVAVGIGVLATLVLGVVPEPLLRLAHDAATTLFVR
jgi:NADH-quinone oxidoreductase subunit N